MLAVAVDVEASALKNPKTAAQLLNEIGRAVPSRRRNRNAVIPQPAEIPSDPLVMPAWRQFTKRRARSSSRLSAVETTSLRCKRTKRTGFG
jgi:hypothetical protein